MRDTFRQFSQRISAAVGSPLAFMAAAATILTWALVGPLFHFSDTWQLVINTGTTIVTFLMVFVIQTSQNRDTRATQLKLDELLRAVRAARNSMIRLEELSEDELAQLQRDFEALSARARPGESAL